MPAVFVPFTQAPTHLGDFRNTPPYIPGVDFSAFPPTSVTRRRVYPPGALLRRGRCTQLATDTAPTLFAAAPRRPRRPQQPVRRGRTFCLAVTQLSPPVPTRPHARPLIIRRSRGATVPAAQLLAPAPARVRSRQVRPARGRVWALIPAPPVVVAPTPPVPMAVRVRRALWARRNARVNSAIFPPPTLAWGEQGPITSADQLATTATSMARIRTDAPAYMTTSSAPPAGQTASSAGATTSSTDARPSTSHS